jgi:hypothetical protein
MAEAWKPEEVTLMDRRFVLLSFLFGAVAGLASACGSEATTTFSGGADPIPAVKGTTYRVTFDPGSAPGFPVDFAPVLGDFRVVAEPSAPSPPNVLRQVGSFDDNDFPRTILGRLTFGNVVAKVRCRPESGVIDAACGMMVRVRDSENYYIARANANENNVRLYRVVVGDRQQIASASVSVAPGTWHTLSMTAIGAQISVSWDDAPLITANDATFSAGKVGLWTKADSVTSFDDLEVTAQ